MLSQREKATAFRSLHQRPGAFVIPNPWDIGSARLLTALGFEALATTSAGLAHALGRLDGSVTLDEKVEHCRALSAAVDVPVSADLENCYADDPEVAARSILRAAQAGAVGGSIEDYSGDESRQIYDFDLAVERVHAAAEAAASLDFPFTLTARADNHLRGRDDLFDTVRRLQAFEAAGADVLYAPGLESLANVRTITMSMHKPVNVLAPPLKGVTVSQLAEVGVKRISIGGALARAAIAAVVRAGREMRDLESFTWTSDVAPGAELEKLLGGYPPSIL